MADASETLVLSGSMREKIGVAAKMIKSVAGIIAQEINFAVSKR